MYVRGSFRDLSFCVLSACLCVDSNTVGSPSLRPFAPHGRRASTRSEDARSRARFHAVVQYTMRPSAPLFSRDSVDGPMSHFSPATHHHVEKAHTTHDLR